MKTKAQNINMKIGVLSVLCCLSVMIMIYNVIKTDKGEFVPPAFDTSSLKGAPNVPEQLGYSFLEVECGYSVYICGKLLAQERNVDVYFTSPESNEVWLLLRFTDEKGNILGETGIIRPGEYIKTLTLNTLPNNECNVKLKFIAYQPKTYISMGTVELNTKLNIYRQE